MLNKVFQNDSIAIVLSVVAGAVASGAGALALSQLPFQWTLLVCLGMLAVLPTLIVKDVKLYWLILFLVSLPIQISKNLTNYVVDPLELVMNFGLPPSGNITIKVYPSDILLGALIVQWLLRSMKRKHSVYFPPAGNLALAYLGWAAISSVSQSQSLSLSVFELFRQSIFFLTFLYFANNVDSQKTLNGLAIGLLLSLLIEEVVTIGKYVVQDTTGGMAGTTLGLVDLAQEESHDIGASVYEEGSLELKRSTGTFGHPAHAALFFELLVPLSLILCFTGQTRKYKLLYAVLFILGVAAMMVTFSRSGFLGLTAGMACCLWLAKRCGLVSQRQWLYILLAGLILLSVLSPMLYNHLMTRPEMFNYRFTLLKQGVAIVESSPILGVGLNNSSAANPEFEPKRIYERGLFKQWDFMVFHNHYQILVVETGIVGFLLYMGFFIWTTRNALSCSRSSDWHVASVAIAIVSSYVAVAVHVNGDPFAGNSLNTLLWAYAGVVAAFQKNGEVTKSIPGMKQ